MRVDIFVLPVYFSDHICDTGRRVTCRNTRSLDAADTHINRARYINRHRPIMSTGACILSSVVGAPQQKRQQAASLKPVV